MKSDFSYSVNQDCILLHCAVCVLMGAGIGPEYPLRVVKGDQKSFVEERASNRKISC